MQAAKYWRNNKLRYRLIRAVGDRRANLTVDRGAKAEQAPPKRGLEIARVESH